LETSLILKSWGEGAFHQGQRRHSTATCLMGKRWPAWRWRKLERAIEIYKKRAFSRRKTILRLKALVFWGS
jgi:hypothetical protein